MLDITTQIMNMNSYKMVTMNEKFQLQLNSPLGDTRNNKTLTLNAGESYSETCNVDYFIMQSNNPVTLIMDGVTIGNGSLFTINKTNGIQSFSLINGITSGFIDKSQSVLSYNRNTRTITLTPVNASYTVMYNSVAYTISNIQSIQHDNTTGNYYCGYTIENDVIVTDLTTSPLPLNYIPICYVSFNASDTNATFYSDERDVTTSAGAIAEVKIFTCK